MHETFFNSFKFEIEKKHKNHLKENENSKIQNLFNFGKIKYGEMGNFISFPNLIFAKFYICILALKTLVSFLFSMKKGLAAKFPKTPGGSL